MKMVSDLKYQDTVYCPDIGQIIENKVKSILSDVNGTVIEVHGIPYPMRAKHNDTSFNSLHPFYTSKDEAIQAQRNLRLARLNQLRKTVQKSMEEIDELINKLAEENEG